MMVSKGQFFIERLRAGPVDRDSLGGREPANQSDPREAGAQRGAAYPGHDSLTGDPNIEVDLLGGDGGRQAGGWRSSIAIVAALAVFAGVLWYGYNWGIEQLATTRIPVIVADTAPLKSRPESPGGIEVLNQDVAVLNDAAPGSGEPQAERLLPPPEAPQIAQTEAPQGLSVAEVENLLGPSLETAAGPIEGLATTEQTQASAAPQIAAPEIAVPEIAVPQFAAASPPEAAVEPALPEPQVEALPVPEPTVAVPAEAKSEPAAQIAALPEAKAGDYVVQLAALRVKDRARPAWVQMQKSHPSLLSDRELAIQKVDLGDRGIFYRVQAGFFVDRAGASELCSALKVRGQDCLVVKR
jgi:cell division septation protein DedD